MITWEPSATDALKKIAGKNGELALLILSTVKMLEKIPTTGELALRPDSRYYSDLENQFRISYISSPQKKQIHVTVLRVC